MLRDVSTGSHWTDTSTDVSERWPLQAGQSVASPEPPANEAIEP